MIRQILEGTTLLLIVLIASTQAATIYVPDHQATIRNAIIVSSNGDTIIVRPGTYQENITFLGKSVTVRSEKGPGLTVIDGGQLRSVVTFSNDEDEESVLDGFTLTNGDSLEGGGIHCYYASPTIVNNIISGNTWYEGGGIFCYGSSPVIKNNLIIGNTAKYGGGIYSYWSSPTITDNIITGNSVNMYGGGIQCAGDGSPNMTGNTISMNHAWRGGGLYCGTPTTIIINNTITGNTASSQGGGIYCGGDFPIANTIFWDNSAPTSPEIFISSGYPAFTYCDIKGGWPGTGNIDVDPLFADSANGDFHLTFPSSCRNAGDNSAITFQYDCEGDPRIAQGTVDIGADEFYHHLYYTGNVLPGSPINIKVIGTPGFPTLLGLGKRVQDPPQSTPHGDLWLTIPPAKTWQLGVIPGTGVLTMSVAVPSGWPVGSQHPFQALVGLWGGADTKLTNLMVLTAE